jgi:DNA-binding IclR family transcriptional regulator
VELRNGTSPLNGAQSVDRALVLLALIGRQSAAGIALSELVARSGLNKATVRRLLLALIRAGLVEQDAATRSYHLGEQAFVLGTQAQARHGLVKLAMEGLLRLARETGDAAFISVRRGMSSVCLHREDGPHPIRTFALMPGGEHPLGVGAGSLAMLAALPDAEVAAVLHSNAQILCENYPNLPPEVLREHVTRTRTEGHALNPGLIFEDSWGLGIALKGPDGSLAGALSLAAVESRMKPPRRADLVVRLKAEAVEIEKRLAQAHATRPARAERRDKA